MKKNKLAVILSGAVTLLLLGTSTVSAQEAGSAEDTPVVQNVEEHTWGTSWTYTDSEHWRQCLDDGCYAKTDRGPHTYEWGVGQWATDTEEGYKWKKCTQCGHDNKDEIIAIPPVSSSPVFVSDASWDGNGDIVFNVDEDGGQLVDIEVETTVKNGEVYGTGLNYITDLDENGVGTITFKRDELKKLSDRCIQGGVELKDLETITFYAGFYYPEESGLIFRTVTLLADFASTEPETTVTISGEAGVTMTLPETAADGLELKVTVFDGDEEKTAVNKVVQIDGEKIVTYDLSLLKDGQLYPYNGQFVSTIKLPVPDGWDMDHLALYYFNTESNEAVPVEFEIDKENSLVIFSTDHFSRYVLAQKAIETNTEKHTEPVDNTGKAEKKTKDDESSEKASPKTGDGLDAMYWEALFVMSLILFIGFSIYRKGKN